MKKFFVIAILCLVPISFVGAEQPEEVIEVEETSRTVGNAVTTTETVTVTTIPKKYDLSKRWYFGGGLNYAFENFKDSDGDWGNTFGFNIKGGYFLCEYFALEAMFQYLDDFELQESGVLYSPPYYYSYDYDVNISLYHFTINGKGFIPIKGIVKPYGVLGFGYAYGKAKQKLRIGRLSATNTEKESDLCGRIGAGLDIFLSEQFALEGEVSYFMGFNDIDRIRYTSLSLNALVLF